MRSIHVDSTIKEEAFLEARDAADFLGVKLQTLYAYASRGLVASVPGESGRARLYARADLERLRTKHDARAGHAPVAAAALRWGEPVLDSALTAIDARGPHYLGKSAVALAEAGTPFESVAELLWGGSLPETAPAWPKASFDLKVLAPLLPPDAPPLVILSMLLPVLAARDLERFAAPREADVARARGLLGAMALALAPVPAGRTPPPRGKAKRAGLAAAVAAGLGHPSAEVSALIDRALVLMADHELNVSCFTARVAASAGADLYACVSAALAAISGPLHGGACDRVEALVNEVGRPERARAIITERARRGESIPGFGHPLYPDGDPRAACLLAAIDKLQSKAPQLKTLQALIKAMADTERGRPTVDVALVALSLALGARPGTAAGLFALGRCAGWVAHILEQRDASYLLRPRARYTGPSLS